MVISIRNQAEVRLSKDSFAELLKHLPEKAMIRDPNEQKLGAWIHFVAPSLIGGWGSGRFG
ncbi:MAG: hypothetical protein P4K86_00035 [Terracidiphilus sp.]|nr:hypothetical protein [Terracidiphilus sp.]MDR3775461.1 hypothetical protein [Terracidiphilus sp.]